MVYILYLPWYCCIVELLSMLKCEMQGQFSVHFPQKIWTPTNAHVWVLFAQYASQYGTSDYLQQNRFSHNGCICWAFPPECGNVLHGSHKSSGHWLMRASGSLFTQCLVAGSLLTKIVQNQWKYLKEWKGGQILISFGSCFQSDILLRTVGEGGEGWDRWAS